MNEQNLSVQEQEQESITTIINNRSYTKEKKPFITKQDTRMCSTKKTSLYGPADAP